jgi:hypothetical protein
VTAGGDNPDAFEDLINGYALRENGGLDRSANRIIFCDTHLSSLSATIGRWKNAQVPGSRIGAYPDG